MPTTSTNVNGVIVSVNKDTPLTFTFVNGLPANTTSNLYISYWVNYKDTNAMAGMDDYRAPTVSLNSSSISASDGTITPIAYFATLTDDSSSSPALKGTHYIWQATVTPPNDFAGDISFSLPSNAFKTQYTILTSITYNLVLKQVEEIQLRVSAIALQQLQI